MLNSSVLSEKEKRLALYELRRKTVKANLARLEEEKRWARETKVFGDDLFQPVTKTDKEPEKPTAKRKTKPKKEPEPIIKKPGCEFVLTSGTRTGLRCDAKRLPEKTKCKKHDDVTDPPPTYEPSQEELDRVHKVLKRVAEEEKTLEDNKDPEDDEVSEGSEDDEDSDEDSEDNEVSDSDF